MLPCCHAAMLPCCNAAMLPWCQTAMLACCQAASLHVLIQLFIVNCKHHYQNFKTKFHNIFYILLNSGRLPSDSTVVYFSVLTCQWALPVIRIFHCEFYCNRPDSNPGPESPMVVFTSFACGWTLNSCWTAHFAGWQRCLLPDDWWGWRLKPVPSTWPDQPATLLHAPAPLARSVAYLQKSY